MGLITRKAANAVTPTVELRKDGDNYNLVTSSTFKTTECKFKPGEEFDEERADGAKVRVTAIGFVILVCSMSKFRKQTFY